MTTDVKDVKLDNESSNMLQKLWGRQIVYVATLPEGTDEQHQGMFELLTDSIPRHTVFEGSFIDERFKFSLHDNKIHLQFKLDLRCYHNFDEFLQHMNNIDMRIQDPMLLSDATCIVLGCGFAGHSQGFCSEHKAEYITDVSNSGANPSDTSLQVHMTSKSDAIRNSLKTEVDSMKEFMKYPLPDSFEETVYDPDTDEETSIVFELEDMIDTVVE